MSVFRWFFPLLILLSMVLAKLLKPDKTPPTPLEEEIANTLLDLQSHDDMSESIKMLYFCGAKVGDLV